MRDFIAPLGGDLSAESCSEPRPQEARAQTLELSVFTANAETCISLSQPFEPPKPSYTRRSGLGMRRADRKAQATVLVFTPFGGGWL